MRHFTIYSIIFLASCGTNSQKEEQQVKPIDLKTQIETGLKKLKTFDNSLFQKNTFYLKVEVATFFNLAIVAERAFSDKDPEIIKLGRTLSEKLEQIQTKEFPLMRKRYIELLTKRLDLYDAKAECGGEACNSLRITSSQFDSWNLTERQVRNRRSFQNSIKDEVRLFRFKSVSYQEKKKANGTFSFQMTSLDDNEIAILNSNRGATFYRSLFEEDLEKIKLQTENELNGITSHLSDGQFNGDISGLKLFVANYFDIATVIEKALCSGDSAIIQMGLSLRNKLKEIQMKEFPIIRKYYANLVVNELLRYGANVKCLDKNCETLLLTSIDFDTNRTDPAHVSKRVDCHKKIEECINLFRFKLVIYGKDEATSNNIRYPIKSLDDDEVVLYKSSPEEYLK